MKLSITLRAVLVAPSGFSSLTREKYAAAVVVAANALIEFFHIFYNKNIKFVYYIRYINYIYH